MVHHCKNKHGWLGYSTLLVHIYSFTHNAPREVVASHAKIIERAQMFWGISFKICIRETTVSDRCHT